MRRLRLGNLNLSLLLPIYYESPRRQPRMSHASHERILGYGLGNSLDYEYVKKEVAGCGFFFHTHSVANIKHFAESIHSLINSGFLSLKTV